MINNFILTRYTRDTFDNAPLSEKHNVESLNMADWDNVQEILFKQQIKQLNKFYPNCNIHVITNNSNLKSNNNFTAHLVDWKSSHLCKLFAYGLLKEPAMYMDNDILMNRKFEEKHLPIDNPFNFYMKSLIYDVQKLSSEKLPVEMDHHFNGGIIWIPNPSVEMRDEMINLHQKYFSDRQKIMDCGRWADSDELPATLYAIKNKMKMKLSDEVSVQRKTVDLIRQYQTIHYTGLDIETKRLCVKEYIKHNVKIY